MAPVFAQWIANWLVTVSFPPTVAALGPVGAYGVYLFFAVVSFVLWPGARGDVRG